MGYRRGFKTEANWYAREMRRELGLVAHAPLSPWTLAIHLGFVVKPLASYAGAQPEAVAYLHSTRGQEEFSAVTVLGSGSPIIVHNDAHHARRQAANISHELAHALLMHKPAVLAGEDGTRSFNREQEDEAHWLGPALLVSEEAALFIIENGMSREAACRTYGVSDDLLRMRLGVTGAFRRYARRQVA